MLSQIYRVVVTRIYIFYMDFLENRIIFLPFSDLAFQLWSQFFLVHFILSGLFHLTISGKKCVKLVCHFLSIIIDIYFTQKIARNDEYIGETLHIR